MKNFLPFLLLLSLPLVCRSQPPGFRKLYSGQNTGATFVDVLWDGERIIATGQFLTDTAPNNALNGLLYMELDTNGNTLHTDIFYPPDNAVTSNIGNSMVRLSNGDIAVLTQLFYDTAGLLNIYRDGALFSSSIISPSGITAELLNLKEFDSSYLLSGIVQAYDYHLQGLLIKMDNQNNIIWEKYYGLSGLETFIGEPYVLDSNTILLPSYKAHWPLIGPVTNKWMKSRIIAIDSLGNIKWEWESEKNVESGVGPLQRLPDNNWLYISGEFIPMPGNIDSWGVHPKIVCRDSAFNLVWERYFSAVPTSSCYMRELTSTSDGNYVAVGFLNDSEWWGACVIHKFAPNGDSIWTYKDYCEPTWDCANYLGGVTELPGGSIVAAGYLEDYSTFKTYGLLIKVDKNGCMDTLCSGVDKTFEIETAVKIKVYPNPASSVVNVKNPIGAQIELFDLQGRKVRGQSVDSDTEQIDVSSLPAGIYLLRMRDEKLSVTYQIMVTD